MSLKVHDLPLQDHKLEVDNEIKSLQFELIHGTKDSIKTKQIETMINKLKMKKELLMNGRSRRFTVLHQPEESYDYRRNHAFASSIALKMRKICWGCNDKGKIIDFEQNQRNLSNELIRQHNNYGRSRDGRKIASKKKAELKLAELVPRDAFGFESVFQITKTKEINVLTGKLVVSINSLTRILHTNINFSIFFVCSPFLFLFLQTGTIGHPINRVSLVAKTSVEICFIPKRDFFLFTSYKTRKIMREKLMNPKMYSYGQFSRIFKDPTNAIKREKLWNIYKTNLTKEFESRHAKYALSGV